MLTMKIALLAIEAVTAIVFIAMSIPLIMGKVPPNGMFGVRVRKTIENEELWYRANAYFGKDFLIASTLVLALCIALYFKRNGMDTNTFLLVVSVVLTVPYIVAVVKTFIYLKRL